MTWDELMRARWPTLPVHGAEYPSFRTAASLAGRTGIEPCYAARALLGAQCTRDLLIDGAAHFDAWLGLIRGAQQRVLLENYIIRDDEVGRAFRDALVERARAGVMVAVVVDWLGCFGQSRGAFWAPLRAAGGQVRVFNPPRLGEPLAWISRDHRKLLVVDGLSGSVSGVCLSSKWLGDPARNVSPWRDTGVLVRGPAVAELEFAFLQSWNSSGAAPRPLSPAAAERSRWDPWPCGSSPLSRPVAACHRLDRR